MYICCIMYEARFIPYVHVNSCICSFYLLHLRDRAESHFCDMRTSMMCSHTITCIMISCVYYLCNAGNYSAGWFGFDLSSLGYLAGLHRFCMNVIRTKL